jgi:hypothetical protein
VSSETPLDTSGGVRFFEHFARAVRGRVLA